VQLSEREHWILLAIHRLLVDCFRHTVFDQIWPIYADLLKGKPHTPPALRNMVITRKSSAEQRAVD